jgi:hypothetical protein
MTGPEATRGRAGTHAGTCVLPGTLVSAAAGIAALVAALLAVTAVRGRVHQTLLDPQTLAGEEHDPASRRRP